MIGGWFCLFVSFCFVLEVLLVHIPVNPQFCVADFLGLRWFACGGSAIFNKCFQKQRPNPSAWSWEKQGSAQKITRSRACGPGRKPQSARLHTPRRPASRGHAQPPRKPGMPTAARWGNTGNGSDERLAGLCRAKGKKKSRLCPRSSPILTEGVCVPRRVCIRRAAGV